MTKAHDCTQIQAQLEALAEGCLAGDAADEIRRHIDECPACAAAYERHAVEQEVFAKAMTVADPPASLADDVCDSLAVLARRERFGSPPPRRTLHWPGASRLLRIAAILMLVAATSAVTLIIEHTVFLPPMLRQVTAAAQEGHTAAQARLVRQLTRAIREAEARRHWQVASPIVSPTAIGETHAVRFINANDNSVW